MPDVNVCNLALSRESYLSSTPACRVALVALIVTEQSHGLHSIPRLYDGSQGVRRDAVQPDTVCVGTHAIPSACCSLPDGLTHAELGGTHITWKASVSRRGRTASWVLPEVSNPRRTLQRWS